MITPVFDMGGTEVYILNLINYLNQYNIRTKLITGSGARENILIDNNIEYQIEDALSNRKIKSFIRSINVIYKNLKDIQPDLIHTSSVYTTIVGRISSTIYNLLNKKNVKVINTLHGGPNENIEKDSAKILNIFSDYVIALSEKSKNQLIKNGLNINKIKVIYNGIDIKYTRLDCEKEENQSLKVLVCGRLTKQKGHVYLLEAFKNIVKVNNNVELLILGDGELKDELKSKVQSLDIDKFVKFLGFKENVYSYINDCDIFILPSLWEQFPITILEAMFFGKPIIATSVNGVKEQIEDAGILINPKNISEIESSILFLLESEEDRIRLGNLAKQRFKNNFTLEKMGDKTMTLYSKLVCERK